MKRGQVTLFVVLGILIVAILAIGVFFRLEISESLSELGVVQSAKAREVEADIVASSSECLKKVTMEGALQISLEGGYYKNEGQVFEFMTLKIPYYMFNKKEKLPDINGVTVSLANYIEDNLNSCLSAQKELKLGTPEIEVELGDVIKVYAKHSIKYSKDEMGVKVSNFDAEVNLDMPKMLTETLKFFDEVKDYSEDSFLDQGILALESEYKFNVDNPTQQDMVYTLIFPKFMEESKDVKFTFAIKNEKKEQEALAISSGLILDVPVNDGDKPQQIAGTSDDDITELMSHEI